MLPFLLRKKHDAGLIVKQREPDEKPENNSEFDELEECAKDFLAAIKRDDPKGMADALYAAYCIADEMPHAEGQDEPSPHSYDSSKED